MILGYQDPGIPYEIAGFSEFWDSRIKKIDNTLVLNSDTTGVPHSKI